METSSGASPIASAALASLVARASAVLFGACAVVTACGSSSTSEGPDFAGTAPSDGGNGGTSPASGCPAAAPDEGAACPLPEGTTCDFGACSTRIARCSHGVWIYGNNPLPEPTCPAIPPESDAACPACWRASAVCTYGSVDCSSPDASANTATATCAEGVWSVTVRPCREGGADVQDAGGDADLSDDAAADAD